MDNNLLVDIMANEYALTIKGEASSQDEISIFRPMMGVIATSCESGARHDLKARDVLMFFLTMCHVTRQPNCL